MRELNIEPEFLPLKAKTPEAEPFEAKRSAEILIDGEYLGVVGEFKNSVKYDYKLAPYAAGFEIDLDIVIKRMSGKKQIDFEKTVKEDLTVTTDRTYAEALKEVQAKYPGAVITPGVIYQAPGQKTRNITFHIDKKV